MLKANAKDQMDEYVVMRKGDLKNSELKTVNFYSHNLCKALFFFCLSAGCSYKQTQKTNY